MMGCSMRNLMWYDILCNQHTLLIILLQWSFGVTCWEVFSLGKTPYPGVDPFSLLRYLERGERLDKPLNVACSEIMLVIVCNFGCYELTNLLQL